MIKTKTCGLSETTRQQGRKPDEICRVHTCICNEGGKTGEQMMRKATNKHKSKNKNRQ